MHVRQTALAAVITKMSKQKPGEKLGNVCKREALARGCNTSERSHSGAKEGTGGLGHLTPFKKHLTKKKKTRAITDVSPKALSLG